MSATLLAFEAGMITGSVIASLTWLWLTRRSRRPQRPVPLSYRNLAQMAAEEAMRRRPDRP